MHSQHSPWDSTIIPPIFQRRKLKYSAGNWLIQGYVTASGWTGLKSSYLDFTAHAVNMTLITFTNWASARFSGIFRGWYICHWFSPISVEDFFPYSGSPSTALPISQSLTTTATTIGLWPVIIQSLRYWYFSHPPILHQSSHALSLGWFFHEVRMNDEINLPKRQEHLFVPKWMSDLWHTKRRKLLECSNKPWAWYILWLFF